MNHCERCGIDTPNTGWCDDCREVEESRPTAHIRHRASNGKPYVVSGRPRGVRLMEVTKAQIREYLTMGIPVSEIALDQGVSNGAVYKIAKRVTV